METDIASISDAIIFEYSRIENSRNLLANVDINGRCQNVAIFQRSVPDSLSVYDIVRLPGSDNGDLLARESVGHSTIRQRLKGTV